MKLMENVKRWLVFGQSLREDEECYIVRFLIHLNLV